MPELPDLLHIQKYLRAHIREKRIQDVEVQQPIVIRNAIDLPFDEALRTRTIRSIELHGPFLTLELSGSILLILNLMLAGRLQHQTESDTAVGYLCFSLALGDGSRLNLCDDKKMAKAYLLRGGEEKLIPRFTEQGVDILSDAFTSHLFRSLAGAHPRRQVRAFINDQTLLSAIGNAYADEILFEAQIHPKTFVRNLSHAELDVLHASIRSVMTWGIACVEQAGQPIHVKVRDHMKVRNRKGQPCSRCNATIRREGVRGYDVFFCPRCQPARRKVFIPWS